MKNVEHQKYIHKSSSENSTSIIYDLIILKLYFGIFILVLALQCYCEKGGK